MGSAKEGKVFDEAGNAAATPLMLAGSFVPPSIAGKDDRVSGSAESIIGVGGSDAVAAIRAQGLGFTSS